VSHQLSVSQLVVELTDVAPRCAVRLLPRRV